MPTPPEIIARVEDESAKVWNDFFFRDPEDPFAAPWLELLGEGADRIKRNDWIAERTRLLTDLRYWLAEMFNLHFAPKWLNEEVHGPLIDDLETTQTFVDSRPDVTETFMYLQARETYKTGIIVPAGLQFLTRDKLMQLGIGCFKQDAAEDRAGNLRIKIESNLFRTYFPDSSWPRKARFIPSGTRRHKTKFDMAGRQRLTDPTILAMSFKKPQTGAHLTDLILDDIVNEETVTTQHMLEDCVQCWQRLAPAVRGSAIRRVVGTFYDDDDLYNYLLQQDEVIDRYWNVPAIMTERWLEEDRHMQDALGFDEYYAGKLMFPDFLTEARLDQKREDLGPINFSHQYLLERSAEEQRLDKDWLQPFIAGDQPRGCHYYMTGDPGASKTEGSSETALCMCAWDWDEHTWIVDFDAGLWNPKEVAQRAVTMWERWKHEKRRGFGMEKVGFQSGIHSLIKDEAHDKGFNIPLEPLEGHWRGIKGRVSKLFAPASAGKLHCERDLLKMLMDQWERYPDPTGRRMDRLDALSYQFTRYTRNNKKLGQVKNQLWVKLPLKPLELQKEKQHLSPSERPPSASAASMTLEVRQGL